MKQDTFIFIILMTPSDMLMNNKLAICREQLCLLCDLPAWSVSLVSDVLPPPAPVLPAPNLIWLEGRWQMNETADWAGYQSSWRWR